MPEIHPNRLASLCSLVIVLLIIWHDADVYLFVSVSKREYISTKVDWGNFGPALSNLELSNPLIRDFDKDGIPNYLDTDDDNDGFTDLLDDNQYQCNTSITVASFLGVQSGGGCMS